MTNTLKINKIKTKKVELEVDFIGGMGILTPQEEKALSEYFKKLKQSTSKQKNQTNINWQLKF